MVGLSDPPLLFLIKYTERPEVKTTKYADVQSASTSFMRLSRQLQVSLVQEEEEEIERERFVNSGSDVCTFLYYSLV